MVEHEYGLDEYDLRWVWSWMVVSDDQFHISSAASPPYWFREMDLLTLQASVHKRDPDFVISVSANAIAPVLGHQLA